MCMRSVSNHLHKEKKKPEQNRKNKQTHKQNKTKQNRNNLDSELDISIRHFSLQTNK